MQKFEHWIQNHKHAITNFLLNNISVADFNLFDVFVMNYVVIFVVTIIFYLFIYKFIIRRVSTKKTGNIDTIQAIRDGDNL